MTDSLPPKQYPILRKTIRRLAFCPRCANTVGKIVVPLDYTKLRCPECGLLHYTKPAMLGRARGCTQCLRVYDDTWQKIEFDDWEAVPAPQPCTECEEEVVKLRIEVEKGGVNWTCDACGRNGVFNAGTEAAVAIRESSGIPAPEPIDVGLTSNCPVCSGLVDSPEVDDFLSSGEQSEKADKNNLNEERHEDE